MRWKDSFTSASTALRRKGKPGDGEELVIRPRQSDGGLPVAEPAKSPML